MRAIKKFFKSGDDNTLALSLMLLVSVAVSGLLAILSRDPYRAFFIMWFIIQLLVLMAILLTVYFESLNETD